MACDTAFTVSTFRLQMILDYFLEGKNIKWNCDKSTAAEELQLSASYMNIYIPVGICVSVHSATYILPSQ